MQFSALLSSDSAVSGGRPPPHTFPKCVKCLLQSTTFPHHHPTAMKYLTAYICWSVGPTILSDGVWFMELSDVCTVIICMLCALFLPNVLCNVPAQLRLGDVLLRHVLNTK